MALIKGFEIIDDASSLEEFEDKIRSKGLSVYQVGDRTVYGLGDTEKERDSLNDAVEDNAFILNLDYARAKLLYVNRETGQIRESKKLMEQFVSEVEDIEDASEGVPDSLLHELIDYVGEHSELVEGDMTSVFNAVEQEEIGGTFRSEPGAEDDKEESEDNETESVSEDEELEEGQEDTEKETKDYLMKRAVSLFDSQNPLSLPKFDELTHKELQRQVIESQFTVSKARDKGINEIYNRLTKHKDESLET